MFCVEMLVPASVGRNIY